MPKLTRREFLLQMARAAAFYEMSRHLPWFVPSTPVAAAALLPEVVVAQGTNADSASSLLKLALDNLGGIGRFIKAGQSVCIKPNATWAYPPDTCSSTDPDLLRTLIHMVREAGASRIVVVDHCTLDPGAAECLRVNGIGKMLDEFKDVEKVFGDRFQSPKSFFADIEFPKAMVFKKASVFKAAAEADVHINMALAKSHWVTKFTICLKHMMGFLQWPTAYHADLEQGIADLSSPSKIQCQLHILEAIRIRLPLPDRQQAGGWGNEINDPLRVKRPNQMVVGSDPVLMDAYALLKYFSRKPQELGHVKLAHEMGLGEIEVDKAIASGRMRILVAGQPTATPTATSTSTPKPTPTIQVSRVMPTPAGPTASPTLPPTETPLPTATPILVAEAQPSSVQKSLFAEEAPKSTTGGVVNPNAFLSTALIPAAAILTGLGIILRRRANPKDKDAQDDSEH